MSRLESSWCLRAVVFSCLIVIGQAHPVGAQSPAGPEFQANTYTSCNQRNPDISAFPTGGFVITWGSGSYAYPQDGSYPGVFGQRFDDTGARVGTEFQVNTYTTYEQRRSAVAVQPDGRFVVVWQSWEQDESGYAAIGRQMNADATPAGPEFMLNTHTTAGQYVPRVATHSGGFVVVWESDYQDGDGEGIFGQRFDSDGGRIGTEFRANSYTRGNQDYPDVAARNDGRFIVVWHSGPSGNEAAQDGSGDGVFAQRYDGSGQKDGSEFIVNQYTTGDQVRPAVAYTADGSFLIAWESPGLAAGDEVYARKFTSAGTPAGSQFRVNTHTLSSQEDVSIATMADGNFVISWESIGGTGATDTSDLGVFGRLVSGSGAPIGEEFQINTYTLDDQTDVRVTGLANGGFAAAWESDEQDGTLDGVFGQAYVAPERACGDGNGDGNITATDALLALNTAVGSANCPLCACDVDSSTATTATDALRILQSAVGQPVVLNCAAC